MLVLQTRDVLRIEQAAATQALWRQKVAGQRTQLAFQPFRKRHAKTLLAAPPDKSRHQTFGRAFQNIFRSVAVKFVVRRQRRREFSDAGIEIRRAHFQTNRHTRAIDFCQDVFRQIKLRIQALHALDHVVRVAFGEHPARIAVDIAVTRLPRVVGQERVLLGRRERAEPDVVPRDFVIVRAR